MVAEGGNLGFSQKGRIEYALAGGKINTDAMDNSAGVDCSDHEVNIKIALATALKDQKITFEERNKILESMTAEVTELVLSDNRLQTQAITIVHNQGYIALTNQGHFLTALEKNGSLNRKIEFLPNKQEIAKRRLDKIGMTRPELCVMLAYAKMHLYHQIVDSDLADDKYFEQELFSYFPKLMQEKFKSEILTHQLRKEIICTVITNFIVNHAGITFINQICQDSGFSAVDVVKAFVIACDSFGLKEMWAEIQDLDGKIAHHIQMKMFLDIAKLLERSVTWLLRNHIKAKNSIAEIITKFKLTADNLVNSLPKVLGKSSKDLYEKRIERYCLNNVSKKLATKISAIDAMVSTFDIAKISSESKLDLELIAKIYFAVGNRFNLKSLRKRATALVFENYYQELSIKTITEDLFNIQMHLAKKIVDFSCHKSDFCEISAINSWIDNNPELITRFDNFISELKMQPNNDISLFVIALNRFKSLIIL